MKIQSDLPKDMDPEMKIRSLQELSRIIEEEVAALTIETEGDL